MFSSIEPVVSWIFSEVSDLSAIVWASGWVGVCIIGLPLARKVIDIFRKIF